MNKATTGKALSAAAIANIALAGFVASPANASTHLTADTIGTTASAMANATAAKPRGFVPQTRAGIKPDSGHHCSEDVCIAVLGHGLHVSNVETSWQGQPGVCRSGYISFASPFNNTYPTGKCYHSHDAKTWDFNKTYSFSFSICAEYNHVPGDPCIPIRG
jgi:hypothetical protein